MTHFVRISALCFALVGIGTMPALSQDMPAPDGTVILTVSGDIGLTNVAGTLQFDRQMFEAIDATEIETTTIWTDGRHSFQGVSLHSLTELLGITEGKLLGTAINDYTVEIPVEDAVEGGPIIAHSMNDAPMSVRDKGPLWIIYPYDSSPDYRTAVIHARSIWQLDRIEVVK